MTRTRRWAAGTAVVAALVLVAGWMLLVAPKRSEAAELRLEAEAAQQTNQGLALQVQQLQAQHVELPAKRAALEAYARKVPAAVELPALVRALTAVAATSGAELQGLSPAPPQPLVPAGDPTSATTDVTGGVSAVPVTIKAGGEFAELDRFLFELERMERAFLVTGMTLRGEEGAAVSATDTATASAGPLTLEVQGRAFVDGTSTIGGSGATVPGSPAPTTAAPTTTGAPAPATDDPAASDPATTTTAPVAPVAS